MTNSPGAFAAPAMFDVLLDRLAADVYPSERFVISAALSARTTDQIDRLLEVLGRQLIGHYLSPRRTHLLGLLAERRRLLKPAQRVADAMTDPDDDHEIDVNQLRSAVELLQQTQQLLD